MTKVYFLYFSDTQPPCEEYEKDFYIGYFASREEAEEIGKKYKQSVAGFCDYPCTYLIEEKEVIGGEGEEAVSGIWIVTGWAYINDVDEDVTILEHVCCISEEAAGVVMEEKRKEFPDATWESDYIVLGSTVWNDGLNRKNYILPGDPLE